MRPLLIEGFDIVGEGESPQGALLIFEGNINGVKEAWSETAKQETLSLQFERGMSLDIRRQSGRVDQDGLAIQKPREMAFTPSAGLLVESDCCKDMHESG